MVEDVLKTKPGPAGQATLLAEQLSDLDGVGRRALTGFGRRSTRR